MNNQMELELATRTDSQKARILKYLKSGGKLTALKALEYFNCMSLAQRIMDLRNEGHPITSQMVKTNTGKMVAEYTIQAKQPACN